MKPKPSLLRWITTKPKRSKKKNEFSELASLLVQKEMRAKDAEKTAIQVLEEYSKDKLAKKYSELSETVVYLENLLIDKDYIIEILAEQLQKCCKKQIKNMKKLSKYGIKIKRCKG